MNQKPTVQFSLIQGLMWGGYACIFAFASVYLLAKGFTNTQVGYIIAAGGAAAALMQPLAGAIADRSRKLILHRMIIILCLAQILISVLLLLTGSRLWITALFFPLLNAVLHVITPLTYSLGMFFIERGVPVNFGICRGIGSVSFALLSALLGILVNRINEDVVLYAFILLSLLMVFSTATFHFRDVDETKTAARDTASSGRVRLIRFLKTYRRFFLVLLGNTLVFISHTILTVYLYQVVTYHGYTSREMGFATTLAAMCELPALFGLTVLNRRKKAASLYRISLVFFFLKNLILYLAGSLPMIYFAMCMHLLGYGLYAGSSVLYVNDTVDTDYQSTGQALMTATCSVGTVAGSVLGGKLLDLTGVPGMLLVSGLSVLAGVIIVFVFSSPARTLVRKTDKTTEHS